MHEDKKANINTNSRCTLQIQNIVTYVQVFPVNVTNGSDQVKINALLIVGLDLILITSELANLKSISQKLEISAVPGTLNDLKLYVLE